ncbi:transient receptor potential cation channel subfamily A member 1 isoform X2 [Nematostella vectensis]|nr:transient receptor potential cation channel subfamily A member 1 isoform X2 [Nematostella vectensis]
MRELNYFRDTRSGSTNSWTRIRKGVHSLSKWKHYNNYMRIDNNANSNRGDGPGPRDRANIYRRQESKKSQCALDSDVEDLGKSNYILTDTQGYVKPLPIVQNGSQSVAPLASSRAMLIYFAKLAKASVEEEQELDFDFLEELIQDGADVNFSDRHGQTILHEVARIWHPDVAKFILENGGKVNVSDSYGRTPLHVAAAVDYPEMVEFLFQNGADLEAKTTGEQQTPTHYAAKNDATKSLKVLIKLGGNMDDRDYKGRTPLQVAAELDRSETAKFLIDQGTAAGVQDTSGNCSLSIMISKMPPVAKEALDQFHTTDRANRKQYYYLNYLEPDLPENGHGCYARTPLQCVVLFKQMDLIMHPVFQRLIAIKWSKFGRQGVILQLIVQLFYVLVWTALAVTLHFGEESKYYFPPSKYWWRIVMETIVVSMTFYFIVQEFWELRSSKSAHYKWKRWRIHKLEKDLQYCHPRWPEERKYLEMELREIADSGISYFNDAWNYFDWITYGWVTAMVLTRGLAVGMNNAASQSLHPKVSAVGIIFIWLRLMKSVRAFATLGPFIVMIGHIIDDTLKFAVLYFAFYFPYICAFWIIFGGAKNAAIMKAKGQSSDGWESFNDLMYSVWEMTNVGNYPWESLLAVDRLMAQLLCGTYIAVSAIVLLNLFIALMSDTFQRVYDNAKANAAMLRASTILSLEEAMGSVKRDRHRHFINTRLAPEELYYDDDSTQPANGELERMTHQIKDVVDEVLEAVKEPGANHGNNGNTNGNGNWKRNKGLEILQDEVTNLKELYEQTQEEMRREMAEMKALITQLLQLQRPITAALPSLSSMRSLPSTNIQRAHSDVHPKFKSEGIRVSQRKRRREKRRVENEEESIPYQGLPLAPSPTGALPSVSALISGRPSTRDSGSFA